MINSVEDLGKALSELRSYQDRTAKELEGLIQRQPIILDAQGAPQQSSLRALDAEINSLLNRYLKLPTMREGSLMPQLGDNTTPGASVSVAFIMGMMVMAPVVHSVPMMRQVVPQCALFLLSEASKETGVGIEEVGEKIRQNISVSATDTETGHTLLASEEMLQLQENIKTMVASFVLILSSMGLLELPAEAETNTIHITENGKRMYQHLVSANDWIQEIHNAQSRLSSQLPH